MMQVNANSLQIPLADKSVQSVVTSPPYYRLRNYGVNGQMGLEETPEEFIDKLVCVFREVKRVLKDDGVIWVNMGDSYNGSGKGDNHKGTVGVGLTMVDGIKPKDLMGVPWMLAFALRADGWYLRSDIIWAKPNPMPESVTDRPTKSHEYLFLLSKSAQYYYDAEAIAEPVTDSTIERLSQDIESQIGSNRVQGKTNGAMKAVPPRYGGKKYTATPDVFCRTKSGNAYDYRPLRNKRSVWTIATQATSMAHFATFPEKLVEPCVLAGSRVGDIVLDPFAGSGTVERVCTRLNRKSIGLELNFKYISEIASVRTSNIQPFLVLSGADGKVE